MTFVKNTSTYRFSIKFSQKYAMNLDLLYAVLRMFGYCAAKSHPKRDFHTFVITDLPSCIEGVQYFGIYLYNVFN